MDNMYFWTLWLDGLCGCMDYYGLGIMLMYELYQFIDGWDLFTMQI